MTPFPIDPARAQGPMRIVLSAYPDRTAARKAVRGALSRRLVACASVVPVDSEYWWRGRIEATAEALVLFKTVPKRVGRLCRYLKETHPYALPEIAELDVPRADDAYLSYLARTLDPDGGAPGEARRPTRPAGPRARGARVPGRTRGQPRRPSR